MENQASAKPKSQKLIDMDVPSPRSVPPSERTIAATHQISQIQQARYRHSRAVEEADDVYSAVSTFHCHFIHTPEALLYA